MSIEGTKNCELVCIILQSPEGRNSVLCDNIFLVDVLGKMVVTDWCTISRLDLPDSTTFQDKQRKINISRQHSVRGKKL